MINDYKKFNESVDGRKIEPGDLVYISHDKYNVVDVEAIVESSPSYSIILTRNDPFFSVRFKNINELDKNFLFELKNKDFLINEKQGRYWLICKNMIGSGKYNINVVQKDQLELAVNVSFEKNDNGLDIIKWYSKGKLTREEKN